MAERITKFRQSVLRYVNRLPGPPGFSQYAEGGQSSKAAWRRHATRGAPRPNRGEPPVTTSSPPAAEPMNRCGMARMIAVRIGRVSGLLRAGVHPRSPARARRRTDPQRAERVGIDMHAITFRFTGRRDQEAACLCGNGDGHAPGRALRPFGRSARSACACPTGDACVASRGSRTFESDTKTCQHWLSPARRSCSQVMASVNRMLHPAALALPGIRKCCRVQRLAIHERWPQPRTHPNGGASRNTACNPVSNGVA